MSNGEEIGQTQDEIKEETSENLSSRETGLQRLRGLSRDNGLSDIEVPDVGAVSGQIVSAPTDVSVDRAQREDPSFSPLVESTRGAVAREEGAIESFAKEGAKLGPEIPLTIGEYAGHFFDWGSWNATYHGAEAITKKAFGADPERVEQSVEDADFENAGNALTQFFKEAREGVDDGMFAGVDWGTYREDPQKVWDPTDAAWYSQLGSDIVRTMSAFAILGGAGGAATRAGIAAGTRAVGAAASTTNKLQKAGQVLDSIGLSQMEGMAESAEAYRQTHQKVLRKHIEDGKPRDEAERLAKKAAGHSGATAAGVTMIAIPALNYMSLKAAFRAKPRLKKMARMQLSRRDGEAIGKWAERWATKMGNQGRPTDLPRQLQRTARESGFESVEEMTNQLGIVEGEYLGQQIAGVGDESTFGERFSEEIASPKGALAATMGAIGGAGQEVLIRNIPTHQRVGEEGETEYVSANTLEAEKEMERVRQLKEFVQERSEDVKFWEKTLKEGLESGDHVTADRAQDELMTSNISFGFKHGTENQVRKMIEEVNQMDESEAEEQGYDTDKDSPYYYKDLSQEYLDEMEELDQVWEKYQNDLNYTKQERAAFLPESLFTLEANIRSLDRRKDRLERDIQIGIQGPSLQISDEYSVDVGEIATNVVKEKSKALDRVVSRLQEMDMDPSDFSSIQEMKSEINFDEIRSEYLQNIQDNLSDQFEGMSGEAFSAFFENDLESDLHTLDDLEGVRSQKSGVREELDPDNVESDSREVESLAISSLQNVIAKEIRKKSINQKQRLYRRSLQHLESSEGRSEFMNRIKEREAQERSERFGELLDRISNAETVEEIQSIRQDISKNELQAVKDAIETREQEIKSENITPDETVEEDESSSTEPATPSPEERGKGATSAPGTGPGSPRPEVDGQTQAEEEKRTEQKAEDEPTGSDQPTRAEEAGPEREPTEGAPAPPAEEAAGSEAIPNIRQMGRQQAAAPGPGSVQNKASQISQEINEFPDPNDPDNEAIGLSEWPNEVQNRILDPSLSGLKQETREEVFDQLFDLSWNPKMVKGYLERVEGMDVSDMSDSEAVETARQNLGIRQKEILALSMLGDRRNSTRRTEEYDAETGVEPQNVSDSEAETRREVVGDAIEDVGPMISKRWNTVNYLSRPFEEIDGDKVTVSNSRAQGLNKLAETNLIEVGDTLTYKLEKPGQKNNTEPETIDDVESLSENQIVEETTIGVYAQTEDGEVRIGAVPLPENISQNNTRGNERDIEQQKTQARNLRRRIAKGALSDNVELTGSITEKRTGHLSIRYEFNENGDPVYNDNGNQQHRYLPLNEAINNWEETSPTEKVYIYAIKDGKAHITDGDRGSLPVNNDFRGKESMVEGSVGITIPTSNGERVAVPVQIPRLRDLNTSGVIDRVTELVKDSDMSKQELKAALENFVFVKTGDADQVFNNDSEPLGKPRIMVTEGGNVTIGRNGEGPLYSTDPGFLREGARSLTGQEHAEAVAELISEMHLNVDLSKVNREKETNDPLIQDKYESYDDFLRDNLETDLIEESVEDFNGQTRYIYTEQPTYKHQPTFSLQDSPSPSGQTQTTPEQGEPINESGNVNTDISVEERLSELADTELVGEYNDVIDALDEAWDDQNLERYSSLYERLEIIRQDIEKRLTTEDAPPMPPNKLETEGVEASVESELSSGERGEIEAGKQALMEEINNIRTENPGALRTLGAFNRESRFNAQKVIAEGNAAGFVIDANASDPINLWKFEYRGREYYIPAPKRTGGYENIPSNFAVSFEDEGGATDFLTRREIDIQEDEGEQVSTETEREPAITTNDDEYENFIDNNEVSESTLDEIARRVSENRELTQAEKAVRREFSNEIEDRLQSMLEVDTETTEESTPETDLDIVSGLSNEDVDALTSSLQSIANGLEAGLPGVEEISRDNLESKDVSDRTLEIYDEIVEDADSFEDIQDTIDEIRGQERARIVSESISYDSLSGSEKLKVDRIAEINQKISELEEQTSGEQQSGEDFLARQESGETAAQAQAGERAAMDEQMSLFEEMRELSQDLGISQSQATKITEKGQDIPPEYSQEPTEESTQQEEEEEVDQEFDPSSMELKNIEDPQVKSWWRDAGFEEAADHLEELYNEGDGIDGNGSDDYIGVTRFLRGTVNQDGLYSHKDWVTSGRMSTPKLIQSLREEAEESAVDEQSTEEEWQDDPAIDRGLEAFNNSLNMDRTVADKSMSEENSDEVVAKMQDDGSLKITCKS